MPAFGSETE